MCRPVTCKTCSKTTWAGCGQHVAQVRSMVPASQWCAGGHTKEERAAGRVGSAPTGFARFLGRR